MNRQPFFLNYLVAEGLFPKDDLFLIDVGASGGIDPRWLIFRQHLRAVGFDPLVNEVRRLSTLSPSEKVSYVDAFVGAKNQAVPGPPWPASDKARSCSNYSFSRSSSVRATKLGAMDYVKEAYNRGQEVLFSSRRITLDDYFPSEQRGAIDFLKIDTDGSDYQVLMGAKELLESGALLGITVECHFHGDVHEHSNIFCNIDRFLRGCGFSLFDLDVQRYSRAELPRPFLRNDPGPTLGGQAQWAEALYFRDLADADYAAMWSHSYDVAKQTKLACLFELFHLQDCAAELLLRNRAMFEAVLPVDRCLDLLTPGRGGQALRYQDHEREFAYWASRRQWLKIGRAAPGDDSSARLPEVLQELCARLGRFLGRNLPVPAEEFKAAHSTLLAILDAKDSRQAVERLRAHGAVPAALEPLLLYHLGKAWKEQNVLFGETLERIYGWLVYGLSPLTESDPIRL
jgi:FkbM family methyltransferase